MTSAISKTPDEFTVYVHCLINIEQIDGGEKKEKKSPGLWWEMLQSLHSYVKVEIFLHKLSLAIIYPSRIFRSNNHRLRKKKRFFFNALENFFLCV